MPRWLANLCIRLVLMVGMVTGAVCMSQGCVGFINDWYIDPSIIVTFDMSLGLISVFVLLNLNPTRRKP